MSSLRGRRKTQDPCPGCGLHRTRCICALIQRLDLKTRVVLLVHAKELKRTTNSGRLAIQALSNSAMRIRGALNEPTDLSDLLSTEYESFVFYPSEDALDLADIRSDKPVQLLVPDGNWRQAAKINSRPPELRHLRRVKLNQLNPAEHHLRREHRANGFSTLEAIARALKILEGETAGELLLAVYRAKLAATLRGRGWHQRDAPKWRCTDSGGSSNP